MHVRRRTTGSGVDVILVNHVVVKICAARAVNVDAYSTTTGSDVTYAARVDSSTTASRQLRCYALLYGLSEGSGC